MMRMLWNLPCSYKIYVRRTMYDMYLTAPCIIYYAVYVIIHNVVCLLGRNTITIGTPGKVSIVRVKNILRTTYDLQRYI